MSTTVILNNVRLAFPQIWEPKTFNGSGDPACSASFILDPVANKATLTAVAAAIKEAANEKWTTKAVDMLKSLQAKGDLCLQDGATKAEYAGFEGNWFVSARNKARPVVVDRNKAPLTQADGRPYAGCYVNAKIEVWAQDNQYGKRINAKLLSIQFARDGEAFSGGAEGSPDDFEDLGAEDGGTAPSGTVGDRDPLFG